jgi:Leucine-rich repeat (LRR) protein
MNFYKFFFIILLLNFSHTYAQEMYAISDTSFLHYLQDSLPNCLRNDSIIVDSAHISTRSIYIYGPTSGAAVYYDVHNVDGIQFFTSTPHIEIAYNNLTDLPHLNSDSLTYLSIAFTKIKHMSLLDSLPNLATLYFSNDSLTSLPDLSRLKSLFDLEIEDELISDIPSLDSLSDLGILSLFFYTGGWYDSSRTPLSSLPTLSNNKNLRELYCFDCGLDSLPNLDSCKLLTQLLVEGNNLTSLPSLNNQTNLRGLWCDYNRLSNLPALSQCTGLYWLYANNNLLDTLPDLGLNPKVNILYLDSNRLTAMPDLSNLNYLEQLSASANKLTQLPLFQTNKVVYLNLSHNQIVEFPIPYFVSSYSWLLNDNLINSLPDYYVNDSFDIIDISQNKLDFSSAYPMKIIDQLVKYDVDANIQAGCCEYYLTADYDYSNQKPFGNSDTISTDTYADTIFTIASQQYADSYQWYHADTAIPGAVDTMLHIYCATQADAGTYTCHSLGQYFNTHDFRFNYGLTEFISEPHTLIVSPTIVNPNLAMIYPTVSSGTVTLKYSLPEAQSMSLRIYDMKGSVAYEYTTGIQPHSEYLQLLNLSGLASGTYTARVEYSLGYSRILRLTILH